MLLFPQDTVNGISTCFLRLRSVSTSPYTWRNSHSLYLPCWSPVICEQTSLLAISNFVWLHLKGILMASFFNACYAVPSIDWCPISTRTWMAYSPSHKPEMELVSSSPSSSLCDSINVPYNKIQWQCSFRQWLLLEINLGKPQIYSVIPRQHLNCGKVYVQLNNNFCIPTLFLLSSLGLFNEFVEKVVAIRRFY